MKQNKKKGFVLILVIMTVASIGVAIFVLSAHANTMVFQSEAARLRATHRNLTASALAWARQSIKNKTTDTLNKPITLDTTNLTTRPATLSVTIDAPENAKPQAQITTSATRRRRTLKSRDKYALAP